MYMRVEVKLSLSFSYLWDKFWSFPEVDHEKLRKRCLFVPHVKRLKRAVEFKHWCGFSVLKNCTFYCTEAHSLLGKSNI